MSRGKKMLESGINPDKAIIADASADLKQLLKRRPRLQHQVKKPKKRLRHLSNDSIRLPPERWPSGRRRSPAKGVYVKRVSWV